MKRDLKVFLCDISLMLLLGLNLRSCGLTQDGFGYWFYFIIGCFAIGLIITEFFDDGGDYGKLRW